MKKLLKRIKLRTWVALGIITVLLPIGILALYRPSVSEATWFDDAYGYRQKISFTHNAALTDRRVEITVDTETLINEGKMQADCDDTRFTDINGLLLDFELTSSCDDSATTYDVVFPTVIDGANVGYVYYSNPGAQIASQDVSAYTSLSPSGGGAAQASEEKGQGPVAYWALDEGFGTNTNDSTIGNKDGTISGAVWQTEDKCVSGKCLFFDGVDDSITVDDTAEIRLINTYSISAWFKVNALAASETSNTIIDKGTGTGDTNGWRVYVASNLKVTMQTEVGGVYQGDLADPDAIPVNQWQHVVITHDGTTARLYVNGKEKDSSTASEYDLTANTDDLTIGRTPAFGTGNEFNGFLDEPKLYNYARTATQIKADFNSRGSAEGTAASFGNTNQKFLSDGLVGYWKMDEASWTNDCSTDSVLDSSGNGNNGDACPNSTGPTGGATGKFGNAGSFDGAGDYVSAPVPAVSQISVFAWYRFDGLTTNSYTVFRQRTGDDYGIEIDSNSTERFHVGGWNVTAINVNITEATDGNWHHIGLTYDGTTLKAFFDGQVQGTTTGSATIAANNINIGTRDDAFANHFHGPIDETRIYNRALSAKEVTSLYNWAPPPVAHWKMDERTGTTINDSSGNGNVSSAFTGNTAWSKGKFGASLGFDGTDDAVTIDEAASVDLGATTDSYTVGAWFKTSSDYSGAAGEFVGKNDGSGASPFELYINTSNNLCFGIYDNSEDANACSSGVTVNDGRWHYASGVRNVLADTVNLYIDGVLATSVNDDTTATAANNDDVSIGNGGTSYTQFDFTGSVDDVKIYNYARTPGQIIEDMNGGNPIGGSPVGSYVAFWALDETNGTTAHDASINANDLTLSTATSAWTTSGKNNAAWTGVGTNWLSRADDNDFDFAAADDASISMWFKSTSANNPASTEYLFAKGRGTPPGYSIYLNTSGFLCFSVDDDASWTPDDTACTTTDVYDATWHHLVAEKTGTAEIRLYVDGRSRASDTAIVATGTLANSEIIYVGDDDGDATNAFNGNIDEVKVYRAALTAEQVMIDMNAGAGLNFGSTAATEASTLSDGAGASPILYYKFDERTGTSTVVDSSGSELPGTINGSMTESDWVRGKVGSALDLDGSNDYITRADSATLDLTSFTLSGWYYWNSLPGGTNIDWLMIKSTGVGADSNYYMAWDDNADEFTCGMYDSGTDTGNFTGYSGTPELNRWYHIQCSFSDSTDLMSLYIDGALVDDNNAATVAPALMQNNGNLWMGDYSNFEGRAHIRMDEVKIYNYARTQPQIMYEFNRGAPFAHWQFDECSGASANNAGFLGSLLNGTITPQSNVNTAVGTCVSGVSTDMWYNGVVGKYNSSLDFDGNDDYVSIPDTAVTDFVTNSTNFTVSAWVYPEDATADGQRIVHKTESTTPSNSWNLIWSGNQASATDQAFVFVFQDAGSYYDAETPGGLATGQWYHVAGVKTSATTAQIWLNGRLYTTDFGATVGGGVTDLTSIGTRTRGTPGHTDFFEGKIDDVRIYNYALSEDQIKQIMNDGAGVRFGPITGQP